MTLAERTREAVAEYPFLETALRAGVVNYAAAARFLDVGEESAVAAALRRYADALDPLDPDERDLAVRMQSGVGPATDDPLLAVGGVALGPDGGRATAIVVTGAVDAGLLERVLARCRTAGVGVRAAGVAGESGTLVLAVDRTDGARALRIVEAVGEGWR
ncbi:MAG: hypothetical protein ABEJ86_01985 [Halococcoides sp.]